MSLPQALTGSMCAEHADAHGRVIVCQPLTTRFDLYVHQQWKHGLDVEEAAARLFTISVDLSAGWSPTHARRDQAQDSGGEDPLSRRACFLALPFRIPSLAPSGEAG
jgi:hypothetical protein